MTKAEICAEISRQTGLEKTAVITVVEKFMEVVKDSLAGGENVYLRGFGTFANKQRAAKPARNITQGTSIVVPQSRFRLSNRVPLSKSRLLNKHRTDDSDPDVKSEGYIQLAATRIQVAASLLYENRQTDKMTI